MRISEVLMRPGGWSLDLTPETPQSVIRAVRAAIATYDSTTESWSPVVDGQIVVFDTDTDAPTLGTARYVGALRSQTGVRSFAGEGIAAYLQTTDGLGELNETLTDYAAQSISDWLDDLLSTGRNGITKGTATTTGLSNVAMTWDVPTGVREMLDAVCARMGAEWRINTDGTLDAADPDLLFTSDPVILVTDRAEGRSGSLRGVTGRVQSPVVDASGITSKVIVFGRGQGADIIVTTDSSAGTIGRGLGGQVLVHERAVNAPTDDSTSSTTLAAAAVGRFDHPRSAFGIESTSEYIRRDVECGDNVWVCFPDAGIEGSTAVTFRGQTVFPQKVRLQSLSWGVHKGYGVYLRRHNGTTESWLRLTDHVQWSAPDASWTVGTALGKGDNATLTGAARLGTYEVY